MTTDGFQLVILRHGYGELHLGYMYAEALARLQAALPTDALVSLGTDDVESYRWGKQSITLTPEGTERLFRALEGLAGPEGDAGALKEMKEALGWGDRLEHELHGKGFLVLLDGKPLYGGIVLDAVSQMAINYPVIRASLTKGGKARFNVLPIHVPFFTHDPAALEGGERDEAVTREAAGDWAQFPEAVKANLAGWAGSETAVGLRKLIRSDSVRDLLARSGKIRP
jgi:hypothetical protein